MHIAHLGPHHGGMFETIYHAATQYPHWMLFWGALVGVAMVMLACRKGAK